MKRLLQQQLLLLLLLPVLVVVVVVLLPLLLHFVFLLLPLLQLPGCVVPEKNQVIFALHRWQGSDKLSFVDALVIEQALNDRAPVASFDRDVCKVPDITVWSGS